MNILHISDIHFRRSYKSRENGYQEMLTKMQTPLTALSQCLKEALEKGPLDLVVITGDLTEDGDPEDYAYLKQFLVTHLNEIPIIITLGNHDIKRNFRLGWLGEAADDAPYHQCWSFEKFQLISFDTSMHGKADGQVNAESLNWLKEKLTEADCKPVIFVTHHHLLPYQYTTPALPQAQELLKILKDHQVLCILNGHTHHQYTDTIWGIPYYTVDGLSFAGEDEGDGIVRFEERYGYNLYRFSKERMTEKMSHTFFPGKLLQRVDMKKL